MYVYRGTLSHARLHNRRVTQPPRIPGSCHSGATPERSAGSKFEFSGWHPVREIYNNASAVWHTNSSGFPEICTRVALSDPPSPLSPSFIRRACTYVRRVGGRSFQEGPQGLSRFPMLLARTRIYRDY